MTTKTFYATFGVGHVFASMYIEIRVESQWLGNNGYEFDARTAMNEAFNNRWSMIYKPEEFISFQKDWNYKKLCTIAPNDKGYFRFMEDPKRVKELKAIELINRDMHMPGPLPGLTIDTMLAIREAINAV